MGRMVPYPKQAGMWYHLQTIAYSAVKLPAIVVKLAVFRCAEIALCRMKRFALAKRFSE